MTTSLEPLAEDIWTARGLLKQMGGALCFSLRMTVVRLPDGSVVLWSPIPMDDELAGAITALGPVRHLVAPNGFHHLYAKAAKARFPDATLWLSPALEKKRADLWADGKPLTQTPPAWDGNLELLTLQGAPMVDEVVAFHRPSATLIATDLLFNEHHPKGWLTPLVLRMTGAHKRLAQSRLLRFVTKDKAAAGQSYRKLLQFPFTTLIIAHGDILTEDARPRTAAALSWLDPTLTDLPKPAPA